MNWRVDGEETVAGRLRYSALPGGVRRYVEVGPGEGALVVRGGEVECAVSRRGVEYEKTYLARGRAARDTETGVRVEVLRPFEWLAETLLGWLVGRADPSVVFFTTEPVRLTFYLSDVARSELDKRVRPEEDAAVIAAHGPELALRAEAADGRAVCARCSAALAVDPRDATRLPELMSGRSSLTRSGLATKVTHEVLIPVLLPEIASRRSEDLTPDRKAAAEVVTRLRAGLERAVREWGLKLVDLAVEWAETDAQLHEIRTGVDRIAGRMLADANRRKLSRLKKLKAEFGQLKENLKDFQIASAGTGRPEQDGHAGPRSDETEKEAGALEEELQGLDADDPKREADLIESLLEVYGRGIAALKAAIREESESSRADPI